MAPTTPKQEAYLKVKDTIPERMSTVLKCINEIQPCTYKEVVSKLNSASNTVTNRMSELVRVGLIKISGTIFRHGSNHNQYSICSEEEARENQRQLYREYRTEKDDLTNDLKLLVHGSEKGKKHVQRRISYCYDKLKLLNRYRVS